MEIGTLSLALTDQAVSPASIFPIAGSPKKYIPFADLVFDVILLEKATSSRTTKVGTTPGAPDSIFIPLVELAQAFDIAHAVCQAYHEGHPKHHQSASMEIQLAKAGLNDQGNLRNYVVSNGGCNGLFLPHHDQDDGENHREGSPQCLRILLLPADADLHEEQASGIMVPILNATSVKEFEDRYAEAEKSQQDMVGRIVYKLRQDLWKQPILGSDLDRMVNYAIFSYASRYFIRRSEKAAKRAQRIGEDSNGSGTGLRNAAISAVHLTGLQVKASGDRATYGLQGETLLPVVEPAHGAHEKIGLAMTAVYQRLVPSQDYAMKRSRLVRKLQVLLDVAFPGEGLRLEVFGSYAMGLGSESSDVDLCITTDTFQQTRPYNDMRALATILRRGGMIQVQPISHARVPIVKFVDPVSRINCDVNTNNVLGIHNSELIRCYTLIDDRVRPLMYNVKALVKKHRINDSSQSWLSSYAYVMMTIGFLQAQDPPILPVLQSQPQEKMTSLLIKNPESRGAKERDFYDCTFDRDYARHRGFGVANTKSVGQLLVEFFEFYTRYFDYQTMEVNVRLGGGIRVRDEITRARSGNGKRLPQPGKGEKKLVVMDPFIRDRNVSGSCSGRHLVRVWRIFEAIYLRLSQGDFQRAFEPVSEYQSEQEQYENSRRPSTTVSKVATVALAETRRQRERKTERRSELRKGTHTSRQHVSPTVAGTSSQQVQPQQPLQSQVRMGALQTSKPANLSPQGKAMQGNQSGSEDQNVNNESKSQRRRLRRMQAPKLPQASTGPVARSVSSASAPLPLESKHRTDTNEGSGIVQQLQRNRTIVQSGLIQVLSDQKKHNDQLNQSRAKNLTAPSPPSIQAPVLAPKKYRQQRQQQQSEFPVLAKTQKLLFGQNKNVGSAGLTPSVTSGNNSNITTSSDASAGRSSAASRRSSKVQSNTTTDAPVKGQ